MSRDQVTAPKANLAGQISLDDAITTMQSGVTDVVTKAGFLK
ncbi:hypothetical protein [Cryobacterium sp. N19]|nr:hypothetical protein [Cryobacterium sp. N19]